MSRRVLGELLNAYVDDVVAGSKTAADLLAKYSGDPSTLASLLELTDDVASLLAPASPSPQFIQQLGQSLAAAAVPAEVLVARPSGRKLWIGALVSGSLVSAVGVLLLWWLRRGRHSPLTTG